MIDFINIVMYLVNIVFFCYYFRLKVNILSFILILFNLQISFYFIYLQINFIYGLLTSIIAIIIYSFVNMISDYHKEIILIKDGNINFHNLIHYYSYSKLKIYLQIHHLRLDEIEYCIMKNHQLLVIRKQDNAGFPVSIILDGKIKEENLKLIHKDKRWLQEELLKKNLLIKNISYAYYRKRQLFFIQ